MPCKLDILRQNDRQLIFGNRYCIAIIAIDDRNRRTPIALPRYAPVPQTIINRALTAILFFEESAIALNAVSKSMPS